MAGPFLCLGGFIGRSGCAERSLGEPGPSASAHVLAIRDPWRRGPANRRQRHFAGAFASDVHLRWERACGGASRGLRIGSAFAPGANMRGRVLRTPATQLRTLAASIALPKTLLDGASPGLAVPSTLAPHALEGGEDLQTPVTQCCPQDGSSGERARSLVGTLRQPPLGNPCVTGVCSTRPDTIAWRTAPHRCEGPGEAPPAFVRALSARRRQSTKLRCRGS